VISRGPTLIGYLRQPACTPPSPHVKPFGSRRGALGLCGPTEHRRPGHLV